MDSVISKYERMKVQQKLWKHMEHSTGLIAQKGIEGRKKGIGRSDKGKAKTPKTSKL